MRASCRTMCRYPRRISWLSLLIPLHCPHNPPELWPPSACCRPCSGWLPWVKIAWGGHTDQGRAYVEVHAMVCPHSGVGSDRLKAPGLMRGEDNREGLVITPSPPRLVCACLAFSFDWTSPSSVTAKAIILRHHDPAHCVLWHVCKSWTSLLSSTKSTPEAAVVQTSQVPSGVHGAKNVLGQTPDHLERTCLSKPVNDTISQACK